MYLSNENAEPSTHNNRFIPSLYVHAEQCMTPVVMMVIGASEIRPILASISKRSNGEKRLPPSPEPVCTHQFASFKSSTLTFGCLLGKNMNAFVMINCWLKEPNVLARHTSTGLAHSSVSSSGSGASRLLALAVSAGPAEPAKPIRSVYSVLYMPFHRGCKIRFALALDACKEHSQ